MPYTSVPKISGAMIDLISRRKTLAQRIDPIGLGDDRETERRSATPTTMAMKIQPVREIRFTVPPNSVFGAAHRRTTTWVAESG